MKKRVQRYLDGELSLDALSPEERAEAEAWGSLLERVRERLPDGAPAELEGRVLRSLDAEPPHAAEAPGSEERAPGARLADLWGWIVRPRAVRVSPLTAAVVAAALLVLIVRPWEAAPPASVPVPGGAEVAAGPEVAPATRIYVEFVLRAPDAGSVSVAGDFNDWTPTHLEDVDGDGVWSGRVEMKPGVHEYMFILDGSTWVTDPNAERYADDGFGNRNAVLAVAPSET